MLRAVDALPEVFREAVVLRYWEKLSTEEIATRLGVPAGTVRSRLTRADGAIATDTKWREHHGGFGYHHAICGMALVEAAGMGRQPATMKAAQLSVDYTCNLYQYGEGSEKFGWRYVPKAAQGDVSVAGWFIMQMKNAKVAGLHLDPASFEGALKFLASRETDAGQVQKETDGYDTGRHRYGYTNNSPTVNTTSIGVLCQLFCGTRADELRGAATWLLRTNPPEWKATLGTGNGGDWPVYYTYYTTLLMFQMGDSHWKKWNEGMKKMLMDNQRKDGDFDGSWDALSPWEKKVGRTYTTALGCLSLEVYYRYMKLEQH